MASPAQIHYLKLARKPTGTVQYLQVEQKDFSRLFLLISSWQQSVDVFFLFLNVPIKIAWHVFQISLHLLRSSTNRIVQLMACFISIFRGLHFLFYGLQYIGGVLSRVQTINHMAIPRITKWV